MPAAELARRFPRVALTHEWLTIPGGSEQVVEGLLGLVPHAELFTTVYAPGAFGAPISERPIHTTVLDHLPGARTHYPRLLPLMDAAWRRLDLTGYDLVLSSSHACAKNVRTPAATVHVCYCHTPMRYAWDQGFLAGERLGPVGRTAFRAALPHLRRADLRGAGQVDSFMANSSVVAERIRRLYGRESTVVHPPVDVEQHLGSPRRAAVDAPYLVFGRIVPYKRVDHAVQACARLGRRVIVAGDGRDLDRVRTMAGPGATFTGRVSSGELSELLATSRALLFPGEEDFGIVPVEAQAAGLPVIGYSAGGVRDSVRDGRTGVLYDDGTVTGLVAAIERFETMHLEEHQVRDSARRFTPETFARNAEQVIAAAVAGERRPALPSA